MNTHFWTLFAIVCYTANLAFGNYPCGDGKYLCGCDTCISINEACNLKCMGDSNLVKCFYSDHGVQKVKCIDPLTTCNGKCDASPTFSELVRRNPKLLLSLYLCL